MGITLSPFPSCIWQSKDGLRWWLGEEWSNWKCVTFPWRGNKMGVVVKWINGKKSCWCIYHDIGSSFILCSKASGNSSAVACFPGSCTVASLFMWEELQRKDSKECTDSRKRQCHWCDRQLVDSQVLQEHPLRATPLELSTEIDTPQQSANHSFFLIMY